MNFEDPNAGRRRAGIWWLLAVLLIIAGLHSSSAVEVGAPVPPERFSDDYYKVYGTPDLSVSLENDRLNQGEVASLFITLTNRGRVTSFQVNEEPAANQKEEVIAAQREQELEKLRTWPRMSRFTSGLRTRAPLISSVPWPSRAASGRVRPLPVWSFR